MNWRQRVRAACYAERIREAMQEDLGMAITINQCDRRHETLWKWIKLIIGAILAIAIATAGFLYAKADGADSHARNNEVALARVEEKARTLDTRTEKIQRDVKEIQREQRDGFKRIEKAIQELNK
jgi:hypothetical protein